MAKDTFEGCGMTATIGQFAAKAQTEGQEIVIVDPKAEHLKVQSEGLPRGDRHRKVDPPRKNNEGGTEER